MATENTLNSDTLVSKVQGVVAADLDGTKVMMSIENGKYYNLDKIGTQIWELLESPRTIGDIVTTLLPEYEVDKETCLAHVCSFLRKMADKGLVAIG